MTLNFLFFCLHPLNAGPAQVYHIIKASLHAMLGLEGRAWYMPGEHSTH